MKEFEEEKKKKSLWVDPQLWQACAGSLVQIPSLHSRVYYFPQGHAEHCQSHVDFDSKVPAAVLCGVSAVEFLADQETDEVYAKVSLVPRNDESDSDGGEIIGLGRGPEKLSSFAKTLTQSDANNGGGFSVPRYCAETIFPRLDYSADPPVQTLVAKDVHGEVWKFRHIYRGTPRRHLLTTGWSSFVNRKKLIAGDSIVFLRSESGELCVGIRRAKRGGYGGNGNGSESLAQSGWGNNTNSWSASGIMNPYGGSLSLFLKEGEMKRSNGGEAASAEEVLEAARLAAEGRPFDVFYYPRASTPEFYVKASLAKEAMRIRWCPGMRFKMPFETEDSSRISWFNGTVASAQVADPIRWPNSPWRLLQVTWDEPDLMNNVKRVSPWLVELVSSVPMLQLPPPFSPPSRKKSRFSHPFDFPLEGQQYQLPCFASNYNTLAPGSTPAGIQGARQSQIGISSSSDVQFNNNHHHQHHQHHNHKPLSMPNLQQLVDPQCRIPESSNESVSCLLTIGSSSSSSEKQQCDEQKKKQFLLFGQVILLTEQQQMAHNPSCESVSESETSPYENFGRAWI